VHQLQALLGPLFLALTTGSSRQIKYYLTKHDLSSPVYMCGVHNLTLLGSCIAEHCQSCMLFCWMCYSINAAACAYHGSETKTAQLLEAREGVTTDLVAIVVQHTELDITKQLHAFHRCSSGRHLVCVPPVMHAEHLTVADDGCVLDAYVFCQLCVSCQKRVLAVDWQEMLGFY